MNRSSQSWTIFLLISFVVITFSHCKFIFYPSQISSLDELIQPKCSVSGVKTVHLPVNSETVQIRAIFFNSHQSISKRSSIEFFDFKSQRIGRIELFFMLNHIQVAFNGLQSSWLTLVSNSHNFIEIKDISNILTDIRLNGKRINPKDFISEPKVYEYLVVYNNEIVDPSDQDWIDLIQDPDIISNLIEPIKWKSPVLSVESVETLKKSTETISFVDSIIFDESLALQISSGISLKSMPIPKLRSEGSSQRPFPSIKTTIQPNSLISIAVNPVKTINENLLVPLNYISTRQKYHLLGLLLASAFVIYLATLLKLSRMTSVKPVTVKPVEKITMNPSISSSSASSMSPSNLSNESHSKFISNLQATAVSKSPPRTLTISLSSPPSTDVSVISTPTVLKVSVPAAFSLADNRHIIFPSKLRNFQK